MRCFLATNWSATVNTFIRSIGYFCLVMILAMPASAQIASQGLNVGDTVIVQNTLNSGLNIRSGAGTNHEVIGNVSDGARGIIIDVPKSADGYTWWKVDWVNDPTGWSVEAIDEFLLLLRTTPPDGNKGDEAKKKDRIVEVLFNLEVGQADSLTYHDYNDYGNCPVVDGRNYCHDPVRSGYLGGHSGWDVQTISVAGNVPTVNERFYSLTRGEVIRAGGDDFNTIAIYSVEEDKTSLYLHARRVDVIEGDIIKVGHQLGIQGNKGINDNNPRDREHVHIEVRDGRTIYSSEGAGANTPPVNINPIDYLYEQVEQLDDVAAPAPDLVVSELTIDDGNTLVTGQDITLRATVRNGGTGESDNTTLRYYFSSDSIVTPDDTEVDTDRVASLDPNETDKDYTVLTAPNATGTYYYGACVDGVVNESDASNNCFVFSVTVQGQDIEQPASTLLKNSGASVAVGDSISLSITVEEVVDLAGWELDINFNPAILSAVSVDEGDFLNEGKAGNTFFVEGKIDNVTGTINGFRVARLATGGVTGSGELLSITFEAKEAGDGELQIRSAELASTNVMNIPFEIKYSSVTVHERAIAWDVNGDGQVNILDLVLVAQNLEQ